ncbi:MAG: hypothetical protein ABIS36_15795 [Chryseolinea sp.]
MDMVLYDEMANNGMSLLAESMQQASDDGYTEIFNVTQNKLSIDDEKYFYEAEEVRIDHAYNFEEKLLLGMIRWFT